jgi:hypothetical protein
MIKGTKRFKAGTLGGAPKPFTTAILANYFSFNFKFEIDPGAQGAIYWSLLSIEEPVPSYVPSWGIDWKVNPQTSPSPVLAPQLTPEPKNWYPMWFMIIPEWEFTLPTFTPCPLIAPLIMPDFYDSGFPSNQIASVH